MSSSKTQFYQLYYNNLNTKNTNNNLIDIDLSYNVTTIGNNSLKNSGNQNDDGVQNTDTININEEIESENKIKEENDNYDINFEIKLKNEPISTRLRSARKFLEENENKFLCESQKI